MQLERSTTSTWRSPSLPLPPSTGAPLGIGNGPGVALVAVGGVVDRQLALAGADDRVGEAVGARRAEVGVEEVAAVGVDVGDGGGGVGGDRRLGDVLVPGGLGGERGGVGGKAGRRSRGRPGSCRGRGRGRRRRGSAPAPPRRSASTARAGEPAHPTLTHLGVVNVGYALMRRLCARGSRAGRSPAPRPPAGRGRLADREAADAEPPDREAADRGGADRERPDRDCAPGLHAGRRDRRPRAGRRRSRIAAASPQP